MLKNYHPPGLSFWQIRETKGQAMVDTQIESLKFRPEWGQRINEWTEQGSDRYQDEEWLDLERLLNVEIKETQTMSQFGLQHWSLGRNSRRKSYVASDRPNFVKMENRDETNDDWRSMLSNDVDRNMRLQTKFGPNNVIKNKMTMGINAR